MDLSKTNCEIDLETLGFRSNSVILSIGAVKFNENGVFDKFFVNVDPKDGKSYGLKINSETLEWWKKQKQGVLQQAIKDAVPLKDGLVKFLEWYGNKSIPTYANGSAFDIPILESNFDACELKEPWKYWDIHCHRTTVGIFDKDKALLPEASGDLHNALVDSILQAEHLINIWKKFNE